MSGPKHLWSGDWELDSSAARQEFDRRRGRPVEEKPPAPAPAPREPAPRPSLGARALAAIRALSAGAQRTRELRSVVAIVIAVLLTAAAGYALTALVADAGSGSHAHGPHAWLGVDVTGSPLGIVVTNVVAGGPGASAGILPGDTLTEIDNQPIGTVDAVTTALSQLRPGQIVPITFSRGLTSYTTQATLSKAPSAGP